MCVCVWGGGRLFQGVPGVSYVDGAQSFLFAALVYKGGQTLGGAVALLK